MITFDDIRKNEEIEAYIKSADKSLAALGFTEHSFAHVGRVSKVAAEILELLSFDNHTVELAKIAAYLHDIGNVVNRVEHAQSGAVLAFRILDNMGMPAEEVALVVSAIGNHDEGTASAVNPVAAALIIADKCDVRRTRVRNRDIPSFDIHDRVNYAVESSKLYFKNDNKSLVLDITIDTSISAVMNYFEIFLGRMMLSRKAAEYLNTNFELVINGQRLL